MPDRARSAKAGKARLPAAATEAPREVTWEILSERLNDIVVMADTAGVVFYVSPGCRKLGYAQADLIGRAAGDLVHPDDLPRFMANTAELFATRVVGHADREHRARCKDGGWMWLEGSPSLIFDADGEPMGIINVFRDVTDRRAAREAMWEEARRASMAEEVAGVGYWRLDAASGRITWSSQMFAMFGLEPGDEPLLDRAMAMVHAEDKAASDARLAHAIATGEGWRDELTRIVRPDGEVRFVNGRAVTEMGPDGRVAGVFGTMIDVTVEAATRRAMVESERRYRLLAENSTDIISQTSVATGRITYLSPSVARVTGHAPEDLIGQRMVDFVHDDDRPAFMAAFAALVAGERNCGEAIRFRGRTKADDWLWLESNPRVVFGADGKPEHLIDITRDVTAQEALKDSLREAVAEAERLAAVKSEFLANMSHEIRTPLTAVLGFTTLLAERTDLAPHAHGHVERVGGAARALLAIVNDVLDFSQLEAGQVSLAPRAVVPAPLVNEVVELFEREAQAKGLALSFEGAMELPGAVRIDGDRVRQVLLNLVGNAVKFTERGQVGVRLGYDADGERLSVEVADTGPGIPAAQRERLFERFTQADGSSTRAKGGSGLGLAISRKLALAMGGEITLKSRVGRGSRFSLSLPAPLCEPPAAAVEGGDVLALLDGVRVLVVDDNTINRELARAVLEPSGIEVSEAVDGVEATEAAALLPVDLILMDLRMPRLDGLQAAWAIRRTPGPNQDIPILAFSADGELRAGTPLGPLTGRVTKPISPRALVEAVAEAVSMEFEPIDDEELRHGHG